MVVVLTAAVSASDLLYETKYPSISSNDKTQAYLFGILWLPR